MMDSLEMVTVAGTSTNAQTPKPISVSLGSFVIVTQIATTNQALTIVLARMVLRVMDSHANVFFSFFHLLESNLIFSSH